MKTSLEGQIEEMNARIRDSKELLKMFFNGEEYYKQRIKKLKTEFGQQAMQQQLDGLDADELKAKIEEMTSQVQMLKRFKPMLSIYNDGEQTPITLDEVQQFVLSLFGANLYDINFSLIKNPERLTRICVFVIEDERLSRLALDRLSGCFEHHIQYTAEENWCQSLLKVTFKKTPINFPAKQREAKPHEVKPYEAKREATTGLASGQSTSKSETVNWVLPDQQSGSPASATADRRIDSSKANGQINQPAKANQRQHQNVKRPGQNKQFTRKDLLLSVKQLIKEDYPLPIERCAIKKTTKSVYRPVTESSPMFALDCEMCKTENGRLDVARISLVDEQLNVLLDELVRPDLPIVDYLTEFSGITEAMLANVTTSLSQVHQWLDELLPEDAILIGHSLNCDLQSLRIGHPYIIDTSCIYNFTFFPNNKPKLRELAAHYLNRDIQSSESGHCPVEDAKVAMELVQLKLSHDITFGDNYLKNRQSNRGKLFKPTMTLSEFLSYKDQGDVKIVYDYLDLEQFPKFIAVTSVHLNQVLDKISWACSLLNSICVVMLKGRCLIKLNN